MRSSVNTLGKQADAINVKVGDHTKGIGGRASKKQTAAYVANMESLMGDLRTSGWSDIGNYLGLTVETVSRVFSRLQKQGVLSVENKEVEILDPAALREMVLGS